MAQLAATFPILIAYRLQRRASLFRHQGSRATEQQGIMKASIDRRLLVTAGTAGAGLLLVPGRIEPALAAEKGSKSGQEKKVGAVEDLMREHGVLRRALLVYDESARRLRADPASVSADAIGRTATLFRSFGEDYHERMLEEAHLFPAVKKAGGQAASDVDVLKAQHDRGREITDYVRTIAGQGSFGSGNAPALADALERFVLMYQNHTAREDTILFPAWKDALSQRQLQDRAERFEDIEHRQFGKDGYEDAVKQISQIEQDLGLADLAQFTAPPPPRA